MRLNYLLVCIALFFSAGNVKTFGQVFPDNFSTSDSHVPLVFEPNRGQAESRVRFLSRGNTYTVLLESDKTTFIVPGSGDAASARHTSIVNVELLRSNREAVAEALDALPGKSNYFIGKDSENWITGIPQFGRIGFHSIYSGIDVVYYGRDGELEYDFTVSPGADPKLLRFRVSGTKDIQIDESGNLCLKLTTGMIELHKPSIYQQINGTHKSVPGKFVLRAANEFGFDIGNYDRRKPLVIDPVLSYSTLIGANNNTQAQGIAVDSLGNVYITGTTYATNYPTLHAFQPVNDGYTDVFVTKLNPSGTVILYSTYLGGSAFDTGRAIAVDTAGNAYVTGNVGSGDFPTTPGAFMATCSSLCNTPFVTKFASDGTLAFSTLMGGSNVSAWAIAVDSTGSAYITGTAASNDLPTTPGSFEPNYPGMQCTSCNNGYVEKLNPSGTALVYSTYFGSAVGPVAVPSTSGRGLAVDSAGSAYLVGSTTGIPVKNPIQSGVVGGPNAFIAKFSPDGSSLGYSTYLGGGSPFFFGEEGDYATGVAVDPLGNVHVTGTSSSCEFPLSLNALSTDCVSTSYDQKIFAITLNAPGNQILFSTFLRSGFSGGIAVDKNGNSYITGTTTSSALPILNPIESTSQQATGIGFVTELDLSGKPVFSTYLGATSGGSQPSGIAVDGKDGIYVTGSAQGDFPILHPIPKQTFQHTYYTMFVAKISPNSKPQLSLSPRVSPVLALRNVSSVPLTISAITPSSNFTQGGNCGASLAPGAGCTLILEGAADNKTTGTVTITSNAYTTPQTFVISKSPQGDGVGSIFSFFPAYVQFPPQLIGSTSSAQQVVLQNSGLLPAVINSIAMIQPAAFTETNDCPPMLAAGSFCTILVTYTAATQQDSAQLAIIADPSQTRYTIFLNGQGSASALVTSTSSLSFGNQFVGAAPLGRVVNITNATPYTTSIAGISTSSGFAQTNTCAATLASQASCRVSVTYQAATNENATGTLTAANLGPGGPLNVNLLATGLIVSSLAVSPLPLNLYGVMNEPPSPGVITLTNASSSAVSLLGFQVSGPFSQTNNCPAKLFARASCSLTVTFKPTQAGTFNGSIAISNSGPNSPQIATLVGAARTVLDISPTLVDFGQNKLLTKVIGYFGMGNGTGYPTVTVNSVTVQGTDFKMPANSCPKSYPPFTGCGAWEVDFTPSATGLRTGTVTIIASDSSSPHIVNLQGVGVSNGNGTLSTTSLNFSSQNVGTTSLPQRVILTNTGTGSLKLAGITVSQQFAKTSNCGASLAPGAKCTISVSFAPTLYGIVDGSLSVQDDGLGSPHIIALAGIGQ